MFKFSFVASVLFIHNEYVHGLSFSDVVTSLTTSASDDGAACCSNPGGGANFLDRQNVDCGAGAISYLHLQRPDSTSINFQVTCGNTISGNSGSQTFTSNAASISFNVLSLAPISVSCPENTVLSQFHLVNSYFGNPGVSIAGNFYFNYRCQSYGNPTNNLACRNSLTTPWASIATSNTNIQDTGSGNLIYLDRQFIQCNNNEAIQFMQFNWDGGTQGRFSYSCCSIIDYPSIIPTFLPTTTLFPSSPTISPSIAPSPMPTLTPTAPKVSQACSYVSESAVANIQCPSGYFISSIVYANYGLSSGQCPSFSISSCSASNSYSIVASSCLLQTGCTVFASNTVFGDPCTYILKSLAIVATCTLTPSPTSIPTFEPSNLPSILPTSIPTSSPTCKASLCPAGQYVTSTSTCSSCPAGKYTSKTDQSSCSSCPSGTYNNAYSPSSTSTCIQCPAGTYANANTGASACVLCPSGQYSATGVTVCTLCIAGQYTPSAGYSGCYPCLPGTHSSRGASTCQTCPYHTTSYAFANNCSTVC